jgi:Glycosyl transferase family 2
MPPLVSVIVRSMGRPSLGRALASIAGQSYRPLEIVLVDAAGSGLDLRQHAGIAVRMAGRTALDRPRAANAGLAAARGAWLVFLDEDDEMAPGHITQLLATATVAGVPVAYSQTLLSDPVARDRVFGGGPFSREMLLRSNYLSIHSVLFHSSLVRAGARFDESLAMFEDWDFWLQLSRDNRFAFTGEATALYHGSGGESGAGSGANLDRGAAQAHRDRLMRKWVPA